MKEVRINLKPATVEDIEDLNFALQCREDEIVKIEVVEDTVQIMTKNYLKRILKMRRDLAKSENSRKK